MISQADPSGLSGGDDVRLILGDCLDVMRGMSDGSVDAVVTDPPAGINFMNKAFDRDRGGRTLWVEWLRTRLAECHRLAKPGARLLCWALPRTSHWTATAVEDAGWVIEEKVYHLFGQGFPKHKSKLKPACEEWVMAIKPSGKAVELNIDSCRIDSGSDYLELNVTQGAEDRVYGGGSGLRKIATKFRPASGRYPANLTLSHSPDCARVGTSIVKGDSRTGGEGFRPGGFADIGAESGDGKPAGRVYGDSEVETWECVEGCAVAELDRQSGTLTSGKCPNGFVGEYTAQVYGKYSRNEIRPETIYGDSGGASRFFYTSKASRSDRGPDNNHPTVKSHNLMRWLVRLITPPDGLILDPFMGSGSTGKAAIAEGFRFVGIEQDPSYLEIAERRIREQACSPLFDRGPVVDRGNPTRAASPGTTANPNPKSRRKGRPGQPSIFDDQTEGGPSSP